jgi:hypothetical protein
MPDGLLNLVALLGSNAVILFALEWWRESHREKRQREIAHLQDQLHHLYSPLHFLICQNETLLEQSNKIMKEYKGYFEGKQWAPEAHKSLEQAALSTIELSNQYCRRIVDNNSVILDILRDHWHLIDDDDLEVFADVQTHVIRHKFEFEQNAVPDIPLPIVLNLGRVHFFHRDWAARIKEKWTAKRSQISCAPKKYENQLTRRIWGSP